MNTDSYRVHLFLFCESLARPITFYEVANERRSAPTPSCSGSRFPTKHEDAMHQPCPGCGELVVVNLALDTSGRPWHRPCLEEWKREQNAAPEQAPDRTVSTES